MLYMRRSVQVFGLSVIFAAMAAVGCGPSSPAASPTTITPRIAVAAAKDVWLLAAQACTDVAGVAPNDAGADVLSQCKEYLVPAHDLIISAAGAVDATWTSSAACDLVQAVKLVSQDIMYLGLPASDASAVADALALATTVAGLGCAADAGGGQ